jgi:hypothetical protein
MESQFGTSSPFGIASSGQSSSPQAMRTWSSPGVSQRKRILTGLGVVAASAIFFWIALSEGASMLVSTVIGIVFIGGFVWYLRAVAPAPFTVSLDAQALTRQEAGGEPVVIPWGGIARVKEELFPNGSTVSLAIYKRVGERGVHRAWVIYGDDLPNFDGLVAAVRESLPAEVPWLRETVHE